MKRLALAGLALTLLGLGACGKDKNDDVAAATTTSAAAITTTTAAPTATTKKPTATTAKATTNTAGQSPPGLVPADSQTPAAGACANAVGGYGDVALKQDIPSPRCVILHDTDHLRVRNDFNFAVTVDDGSGGFELKAGETYSPMKAVGGYWATGVHRLKITNKNTGVVQYGGGGPEIWLQS